MDEVVPPPAKSTFTFTEYDLGNSPIVSAQEGSLSFTLNTKRGFRGTKKVTTLAVSDADGKSTSGGTIDWKNKTIEVMDVTKPWADVKHKPGGALSLMREWKWSGKKYVTTFKKGAWTIKLGEETLAVLTPLMTHAFKKDELATLTFYLEAPKEEMIFLIFAIVFATLQLPPGKKPLTTAAAAGEVTVGVAAGLAANAATTAIFACCTIQ